MRALRDRIDQPLAWRRTRIFGATFQILAPDEAQPIALLEWPRWPSGPIHLACQDQRWSVTRSGVLRHHASIEDPGGIVAATCIDAFRAGTIELPGGECLDWRPSATLSREWVLRDRLGLPLIRCKPRLWLPGGRGIVRIDPPASSRTDLPLLLVAAAYLRISRLRRAARRSA